MVRAEGEEEEGCKKVRKSSRDMGCEERGE